MVDFPPVVMPARPRLKAESEAAGSVEAWVAVVDSPTLSSPELLPIWLPSASFLASPSFSPSGPARTAEAEPWA